MKTSYPSYIFFTSKSSSFCTLLSGPMRTFSLLPLGVLFVCFEAALRLGVVRHVFVQAKQQCRLQRNTGNQVPLRNTGTSTSTAGYPPTSTSSSSTAALPSLIPFDYGTDTIRGVNMCVSIVLLLYLRRLYVTEVGGLS